MPKITKSQRDTLKVIIDLIIKLIFSILIMYIFYKVTMTLLFNACDDNYSLAILGSLEAILGGTLYVMARHFYWNKNSD